MKNPLDLLLDIPHTMIDKGYVLVKVLCCDHYNFWI
jgi:hypothetical protein